jgi:HK97 family phage portal protein
MNLLQRIRQAWDWTSVRVSQLGGPPAMLTKSIPYIWNYVKDQPVWHMIGYLFYARDGFERNSLIYSAIMYKVRALTKAPLKVYVGDEEHPKPAPRTHPLVKLVRRPNEYQSWMEFEGLLTVYLNLAGNSYIYIDRAKPGAVPKALYPLRPDRVFFIPGERQVPGGSGTESYIRGYLYVPLGLTRENGIPFLADEIIHVKLPSASDDYEGMGYGGSPMQPLAQSGDVDNEFTRYLKLLVERGVIPPGILKYNIPIDESQVKVVRARWRERYGGVDNWMDPAILDNGADYKQLSMNFKDMGFETIDERTEARILGPFGVPAILLDTRISMKSSTYANKAEARKAFWEDTMTYELGLFDEEYSHYLNVEGAWIQRDYSRVPALQKNIAELITSSKTLWEMGVPVNTALKIVGMRVEAIPDGDIAYVPGMMVRVGAQPQAADARKLQPPVITIKALDNDDYCILAYLPENKLIQSVQDTLRGSLIADGVNWQKPNTYHLTLAIASGTPEQIAAVKLDGYIQPLVVDGVDQFDTPDGYAIHLRVRRSGDLVQYQAGLVAAMQVAGLTISPHSLTWQPHITLAYSPAPIAPFALSPLVIAAQEVTISDSAHTPLNQMRLKGLPAPSAKATWTDAEKIKLAEGVNAIADDWFERYGAAANEAFEKDRRAIQALVQTAQEKALQRKATIDWLSLSPDITAYLTGSAPTGWRHTFVPVFAGLVRDTGDYWSLELGKQWNVRNLLAEEWFANYTLTFATPINQTTNSAIQGILAQAQKEGWSIDTMSDNLDQVFRQWMKGDLSAEDMAWLKDRLPPYRRELIARTETTRLQGAGSHQLYKSWDIKKKEWLSTGDDRTRPSHVACNHQVRPIDEPFDVGGFKMMHPGDMSLGAPVSEIADCRCCELPGLD